MKWDYKYDYFDNGDLKSQTGYSNGLKHGRYSERWQEKIKMISGRKGGGATGGVLLCFASSVSG